MPYGVPVLLMCMPWDSVITGVPLCPCFTTRRSVARVYPTSLYRDGVLAIYIVCGVLALLMYMWQERALRERPFCLCYSIGMAVAGLMSALRCQPDGVPAILRVYGVLV